MSFNKGDIFRGDQTQDLVIILDILKNSVKIQYIISRIKAHPLNNYMSARFTLVKAAKTGERIKFKYKNDLLTGTVVNELDDGSLVIDSDGPEGMIIGLPESDITHKTNPPDSIWIWVDYHNKSPAGVKSEIGCLPNGSEVKEEYRSTPPPVPKCSSCSDWEQASGWIVGKITFECKICGRLKE